MNKKLVVSYKGEPKIILSGLLLDKQDAWDNLDIIKKLHEERLRIEEQMSEIDPWMDLPDEVRRLRDSWTDNQFKLQEAWGFLKDKKFHKFWEVPGCTCPKMDNSDRYPTGSYYYNVDCPIHGASTEEL